MTLVDELRDIARVWEGFGHVGAAAKVRAAIARIEAADEALLYRARSNWLTRDAYRDIAMKQDGPGALVREQEGTDAAKTSG